MEARVAKFLAEHHDAVMATVEPDGRPHLARIGVGLVDGRLWSSATQTRHRLGNLRRDPRATLMVMDPSNRWHWVALDTRVQVLEGPDAPQLNLRLYRAIAGEPDDPDEYLEAMVRERRLIFEFEILNAYGQY